MTWTARHSKSFSVYIAPNVVISAATHPIDPEERVSGVELGKPIRIGSKVWIGAGSVVNKDFPARCVAAGNPCRVLRTLEKTRVRLHFR